MSTANTKSKAKQREASRILMIPQLRTRESFYSCPCCVFPSLVCLWRRLWLSTYLPRYYTQPPQATHASLSPLDSWVLGWAFRRQLLGWHKGWGGADMSGLSTTLLLPGRFSFTVVFSCCLSWTLFETTYCMKHHDGCV
ncbi:hypothetical protein MAPG_07031 [Magnaporthiopsis poae ATCC 64411]|uniref:Uncharacterized protein n=1 Tax=Magnaporthiopsis poae (strain ATCC 64411 / 73-15) TaxID=644358 RepID=A0A0C4E3M2_MAGP6|nr:hypothetical protein MAPG_07031 [Magnaporthiopsis poae ATCC 64411]